MSPSELASLLPSFCQAIGSIPKTPISWFWAVVRALWPWGWIWIVIIFVGWIAFEFMTRGGATHYNSKNGFSSTFNRVVGGGVYILSQVVVYLVLSKILGDGAYCLWWPHAIHATVFASTWLFLRLIGFWVY